MPNSVNHFDRIFAEQISNLVPQNSLDVGAGAGKYGLILRNYFPGSARTAIEPEKSYIEMFGLDKIYTEIINKDIVSCIKDGDLDGRYFNVIICGDVLEHMFLNEALDVVNYLSYKADWLIVQFPTNLAQYPVDGISWERHLSNLDLKDFIRYNIQYYAKVKEVEDTPTGNCFHHYILMATGNNHRGTITPIKLEELKL